MSISENTELSKEYITQALFELMDKMQYKDISITDITKKAGVGRATYYRHFKTKDDIIIEYFKREMKKFPTLSSKSAVTQDDYYEIIFNVFSRLKEVKDIVKKLIMAKLDLLYLDFLNVSMVENYKNNNYHDTPYSSYYMAGSLFNVSMQWVKNDCAESVKQITDSYFSLMFYAKEYIDKKDS